MNTNSGMPFKKRSNPIDDSIAANVVQQEPQQAAQPIVKTVNKPVSQKSQKDVEDGNREKYTATMEKNLRKRIKIASAMSGIQVSTFIEQACIDKLEREGQ